MYAIGGSDLDTTDVQDNTLLSLDTVDRAKILGIDTRPVPTPPTASLGGDLPIGTWYYRVSALGTWGESLASKEVQILNSGETLQLSWAPVTAAVSYNVYRSPAADGRPGSTRLLATEIASPAYTDDGAAFPAPGFVSATATTGGTMAAGFWTYRMTSVIGSEESVAGYTVNVETDASNSTVTLSWNEVTGATYNIYRTETESAVITGDEEVYLLASGITALTWSDDGSTTPNNTIAAPDGIKMLPPGSLSLWEEMTGTLVTAREGAGACAVMVPSDSLVIDDKTFIYVAGGRPHAGGTGYLQTVEKAEVLTNGDLGVWAIETEQLTTARAFYPLLTSQDRDKTPVPEIPGPLDKDYMTPTSLIVEPIFLFALQGDDSASATNNSGLTTIEASEVSSPDGVLLSWTEQTHDLPSGRTTYGHEGVIVDDFIYCFPGVDMESVSGEPSALVNNTSRFPINIPPSTAELLVSGNYMAANAAFTVPRSYYAVEKVNAHVYLVGGNDGSGPISSVEVIPQ
jgi:hypothetical protein